MVFWGVEVKPGKPFKQTADPFDYTKLHLSQATLGLDVKSKDRVVVKCKVGEGPEILLCSLIPGVVESSSLDLLFDQDVVFSVTGSTPVHLTGYYMPINDTDTDEEYDSDDFSEDTDDSEDEEDEEDSDAPMLEAAPSAVVIEEIYDDEEQHKDKNSGKIAAKKRKQVELITNGREATEADDDTSGDDEKKDADNEDDEEESEDADGFLVLPTKKPKGGKAAAEPVAKAKVVVQEVPKETPPSKKAKKKAEKSDASVVKATITANKATAEAKVKAGEKTPSKAPAVKQEEGKPASAKKPLVRKHPNGLEIHEVVMGKPDGKQAKLGKRVSVIYTGKLKNGKIFDTNVGKKPFLFRLGVGEVIKGWDIGVEGMRVGDKRKLVIPPLLAYGAEGVGNQIPGNSTLTFDVELVAVK